MTAPSLSVVVPTYRGRDSLGPLLDRLSATLESEVPSYEVVVVNDSSPDDTWDVLGELLTTHPELRGVDLLRNHGQAAATMCGLAQARGHLVATMDDDLQHPPEELATLLAALRQHPEWDAVVGFWPRDQGLFRNVGSWVHGFFDRLAYGTPKGFRHSSFRVMRRPVVDAMLSHETRTPVVSPLVRQVSNRVHNVEVQHDDRPYGRSGFRFRSGVRAATTNLFHASTLPLRALSVLGFVCAALAAVLAIVFLTRWAIGVDTPPGWASSFLTIVFFGGATLFGIGLLGEYVMILMEEVRRPPRWSIRQTLDGTDPIARPDGDDLSATSRHLELR